MFGNLRSLKNQGIYTGWSEKMVLCNYTETINCKAFDN